MNTLFELASDRNINTLDTVSPPLFTQRIVLIDHYGQPFAAKVGAGMGEPNRSRPFTFRVTMSRCERMTSGVSARQLIARGNGRCPCHLLA